MRYLPVLFLILLFWFQDAFSQRWTRDRHQLSFGMGVSGFMGDLGGADQNGTQGMRDFDFAAVRPSVTAGYRYLFFENLGVTGNLTFGYVYGDDSFTDEPFRNNRNIHFRSPILELSSTAELTLIRFQRQGTQFRLVTSSGFARGLGFSSYVFAGVAGFFFNPQAYFDAGNYNGTIPADQLPSSGWYNLKPLRTEGQGYFPTRNEYSRISFAIPFGLGAKVHINRDLAVGLRYGFRKTFTDYIDDVSKTYVDPAIYYEIFEDPARIALAEHFSNPTNNNLSKSVTAPGQQRGNPYNTDAYMFAFVTVHYRIPDFRRPFGLLRF